MSYIELPDEKIAELYRSGMTIVGIQKRYGVTPGTIYRKLHLQGVKLDRKTPVPWTEEENNQLISGREEGLTGAELCEKIPTRSRAAIKSRTEKLRIDKLIR